MFSILITIGLGGFVHDGHAQVRINEVDYEDGWVELYNSGSSTVDVSDYQLCTYPNYEALSDLTIISGSTEIEAGGFLVVEWTHLESSDGEVGLYLDASFSSSDSMVDYMQYGSAEHTRAGVAVDAGEWESGEYVALASSGKTLSFFNTEEEIGEEDWEESNETQGAANDPIPVELTSIEATTDAGTVHLTWHTASETNNAGFDIQHKRKEGSFDTVAFVEGHGTTTTPHTYRHTIEALDAGTHVFRLKQIDIDGTHAVSRNVKVRVRLNGRGRLSPVRPTPTTRSARFAIAVRESQHVTIEVYDALGRTVKRVHDGRLQNGTQRRFTLDVQDLPAGFYFVRATSSRFTETSELVVMK